MVESFCFNTCCSFCFKPAAVESFCRKFLLLYLLQSTKYLVERDPPSYSNPAAATEAFTRIKGDLMRHVHVHAETLSKYVHAEMLAKYCRFAKESDWIRVAPARRVVEHVGDRWPTQSRLARASVRSQAHRGTHKPSRMLVTLQRLAFC